MSYFAKITEAHEALRLHPCAANLYRYGLRMSPAGSPVEFEITDWQDFTANTRPSERPYSDRQFYRAKKELENLGVLKIIRRSTNWVKAIFIHPETPAVTATAKNGRACDIFGSTPYIEKSEKFVCGEIQNFEQEEPEEEFSKVGDESLSLEETSSDNHKSSGEGKFSAAAPPEFIDAALWTSIIKAYPAEAISRAWQNLEQLGDKCRDAIAVFLYSLKYPEWSPMSAERFEKQFSDRTQKRKEARTKGDRPARSRAKFLIPEGPWLDEKGRIREDFEDWSIRQWIIKFKKGPEAGFSRESVAGDVFAYFKNDPSRLETQWSCYVAECAGHVNNAMTLLENGMLKPEDKERFVRSAIALKATAEDEDPDETDPIYLQSLKLLGQILQSAPTLLEGSGLEAIAPVDEPLPTVETQAVEQVQPSAIVSVGNEPTKSTEGKPPKIAQIMEAIRAKSGSGPVAENSVEEPLTEEPLVQAETWSVQADEWRSVEPDISPSEAIANVARLRQMMSGLTQKTAVRPLSQSEVLQLKSAEAASDSDREAIALEREQFEREAEEEFSRRKAEALRRLNAFNQSIGDPFGGFEF